MGAYCEVEKVYKIVAGREWSDVSRRRAGVLQPRDSKDFQVIKIDFVIVELPE